MISSTYRNAKDVYFRGNGRWARVTQISRRRDDEKFNISYCVASDYKGTIFSKRPLSEYQSRKTALSVAKDWVDFES